MAVRKKRAAKKSNGHPFLVLLFFISLVVGSAYMTDRMMNAPTADNADQVTAKRNEKALLSFDCFLYIHYDQLLVGKH